jgi:hypothetical protein
MSPGLKGYPIEYYRWQYANLCTSGTFSLCLVAGNFHYCNFSVQQWNVLYVILFQRRCRTVCNILKQLYFIGISVEMAVVTDYFDGETTLDMQNIV